MSSQSNLTGNKVILTKCLLSYIVESPSDIFINSAISCCVVNAIFFIMGCVLNSLVVVIYSMSKQLREKLTFLPVLVLCSVDLVTVTLVHPLFLLQTIAEVLGSPKCLYKVVFFSALYVFPIMSGLTLVIMNVERYLAIVRPLWYLQIENKKKKFMFACTFAWFLAVANFACRVYKPRYSQALTMVCVIISCLITLFVYSSIFRVAWKRRSWRRSEEMIGDFAQDINRNRINFIHNLKIAKIYFIVVVLSFICFLPVSIVVYAVKYPLQENEARRLQMAQVYMWTNTFLCMNSTLNCLVFFWANARLRKEAWTIWRRFFPSEQVTLNTGD
ncbi:uncharacterized protein LOC114537530 [Dendronephthya gigantea]|uniref:uncharacterized protein LOC114537530 n=1 Tax=Dendronephthya gigantea TaxID=151771 RepID=UPI00106CDB7D|nr:uncharacterized protein LOC114537530 [Dendronephthya gigantea]